MNRRAFLASTLATGAMGIAPVKAQTAEAAIVSTSVVITGISAETDTAPLWQVMEAFLDKGIWITCGIRLPDVAGGDAKLAQTLGRLLESGGGIDFAIELPELSSLTPYFQARATYEAQKRLGAILGPGVPRIQVQSVLCREVEAPAEPSGVRAAGVRNVLVLPNADRTVETESWNNGVVRYFGGQQVDPGTPFAFRADQINQASRLIFYVAAEALENIPEGPLTAWVEGFSDTLMQQELIGRLALMTIPDMLLRDDFDQRRLVSVVLDMPENSTPATREIIDAFRRQLDDFGIPSTMRTPEGTDFWINGYDRDHSLVPLLTTCDVTGPLGISSPQPIGPGFALRFSDDETGAGGLDGCAILNLPIIRLDTELLAQDALAGLAGTKDFAIVLSPEQIGSTEARLRAVSALRALRGDATTRFVGLHEFAGLLNTDEPVAVRHRLTRAAMANRPRQSSVRVDGAERDRLLEDARLAWGYLAKYTNPITGLCPATVDSRPGGDTHQAVTMWDVGSNINGIVAAVEIGLTDRKSASEVLKRILTNIRGRQTDDRLLPQGWIRTDRHRWGTRDFDGCDGGRLLSSLDTMRRRFGMADELEKLVDSWDLEKIVLNGEIHSVLDRKLVSTFGSHCAHYSALAFRRWGLEVTSPYETFDGRRSGDGEMAMLEAVSMIGPLGSEPLLLEAMELGMSKESGYLAEVLLAALEEEYAASGRLLCVSETPIDQSPWFIYQGLELGSGPRSWRLDTVGHEPQFLTAEAASRYLTFSTKAAFLWAAYRPGPFSRKLLDFARGKARNTTGFASGINIGTQRVSAGYSDLNTNAVILQAIAHLLRDPD